MREGQREDTNTHTYKGRGGERDRGSERDIRT